MKQNKPKHTPGPWIAAIDPGITTVDGNKCKVFGAKSAFFAVIDGCEYSEGLANARLIAAAPELLDALEMLHIMMLGEELTLSEVAYFKIVSDAIAKARGES